ncbi:MAG: isoprenylcysteine carboxylmethyltransferase family protein [Myxococcota bacterium]
MDKAKAIIASYVGVLVYAAFIFVGAWRLVYWQGILYVILALAGTTISHLLTPSGSTLTVTRARDANAGEAWDRRLLGALFLVNVVTFLVAGLDSGRFGWSGSVPIAVTVAGAVLMLAGQVVFALAKRENAFFSSTVRIQSERNHRACDTGLYRVVRHPGYLGMLLSLLAFPLVLNAYWSFIPALVAAAILIVRTVLDDRFLSMKLPGYTEYAARTPWRLIPGLF